MKAEEVLQWILLADQAGRDLLDMREARPPHQRAVAEHPEIGFGGGRGVDTGWHIARQLAEFIGRAQRASRGIPPHVRFIDKIAPQRVAA